MDWGSDWKCSEESLREKEDEARVSGCVWALLEKTGYKEPVCRRKSVSGREHSAGPELWGGQVS